jgi:hypothetical protein
MYSVAMHSSKPYSRKPKEIDNKHKHSPNRRTNRISGLEILKQSEEIAILAPKFSPSGAQESGKENLDFYEYLG